MNKRQALIFGVDYELQQVNVQAHDFAGTVAKHEGRRIQEFDAHNWLMEMVAGEHFDNAVETAKRFVKRWGMHMLDVKWQREELFAAVFRD